MGADKVSLVYRSIYWYRCAMEILYRGRYRQRFDKIMPLLDGKRVVELCFGDIKIASYCAANNINWIGLDVNPAFVTHAIRNGYYAECANVASLKVIPEADICLMMGSLYHFHQDFEGILTKMIHSAPKVILSEPVINLTNRQDFIGKLAGKSARITGQDEVFRFTKASLLTLLERYGEKLNFLHRVEQEFDKDLIVVLQRL